MCSTLKCLQKEMHMKIEAFSKTYDGRTVLEFPGGEFLSGKIYSIIGPNGSGKSTFAQAAAGILPSDTGLPVITGEKTGYLPQHPYPFHMSLLKNLLLNGEGTKVQKKKRAQSLMDALSLSSLSSKNAASLSSGETARMALARLFMKQYSVLLLDEPCASMDIQSCYQAEDLIRTYLTDFNPVVFLITHSIRQAERLADEVLFFKDGTISERGSASQVLTQPHSLFVKDFLEFG